MHDNNNRADSCCFNNSSSSLLSPTIPNGTTANGTTPTAMMTPMSTAATTAPCEFFQPGEIFQLDTPLSGAEHPSNNVTGHQFESLLNGGECHTNDAALSSFSHHRRRTTLTAGFDSSSTSGNDDDDDDEDTMEFEPLVVHSDYPDIYTGSVPPPMMMTMFGEYSGGSGIKPDQQPPPPPLPPTLSYQYHHHPPAPDYLLARSQPARHGSARALMSSKYALDSAAGDYGGIACVTDGSQTEAAGWKCANTPPPPPPYPHQAPTTTSETFASKYREANGRTFGDLEEQQEEEEEMLQRRHYTQQRGMMLSHAAAAVPGGEMAAKYAPHFGDSVLL